MTALDRRRRLFAGALMMAVSALLLSCLSPGWAESNPNAFNRLLDTDAGRNLPPTRDGIHDPDNPGTALLQKPREAFRVLPGSESGNYVDWSWALEAGDIEPLASLARPDEPKFVLDLDIVREVKGTMPDVVYPHEAHTRWLDCSNCHPAIFIPQKGANPMSMASIMMGEQCGVCHGSVAFPVTECRRCHSAPKDRLTAVPPGEDSPHAQSGR